MPKKLQLILLGIIPLVVGYILNYAILYLPISDLLMNILELGFLFLWGYLAYLVSAPEKNSVMQAFVLCAFGLLMLILVLYQELIIKQYWLNIFGFASQMYFLPFLTLVSTLLTFFVQLFMPAIRIWPFYAAIWICMFAVSCAGCLLKQKEK